MTRPGILGLPKGSVERASRAVVEAVADADDTEPASLPPLYDVVEPDALDSLAATDETSLLISFEYAGYDVRVTGPASVAVAAIDD